MLPNNLNKNIGSYAFLSASYDGTVLNDDSIYGNDLTRYGVAPTFTTRNGKEVLDLKTDSYFVGKSLLLTDSSQILVMHKNTLSEVLGFLRFDTYPVANGNHIGNFDNTIKDWANTGFRRHSQQSFSTLHRFFQQSVGTNASVTTPVDTFYIITTKYTSNPDTMQISINGGAFVSASISDLQSIGASSIMSFGLQGFTFTSNHLSIAEAHFYADDVTTDTNYSQAIIDLKTKYSIV